MSALSKLNEILAAIPSVIASIQADQAAYSAAVFARDQAISAETDRFNGVIAAANGEHATNLDKIEADLQAKIGSLPVDQAAAEKEYADFLASLRNVVSALPASLSAAVVTPAVDPAPAPAPAEPVAPAQLVA